MERFRDVDEAIAALSSVGFGKEGIVAFAECCLRIRRSLPLEGDVGLLKQAMEKSLDTLGVTPDEDTEWEHDETIRALNKVFPGGGDGTFTEDDDAGPDIRVGENDIDHAG